MVLFHSGPGLLAQVGARGHLHDGSVARSCILPAVQPIDVTPLRYTPRQPLPNLAPGNCK